MIGIYMIRNKVNNKCYIGQTSRTFEVRFNEHKYGLNKNYYTNDHFQKAWNKYGEDNFEFEILEIVEDKNLLNEKEKYWIEYYKSYNPQFGYNKTKGGEGGSPTEETKKKISESLKGKNNPMYGTNRSGEKAGMYGKTKIIDEMILDVKNYITHKDFCDKYNVSGTIYYKIRKQSKVMKGKILRNNKRSINMYEDVKKCMNYKDFCAKYNVSGKIYYAIKKEISAY